MYQVRYSTATTESTVLYVNELKLTKARQRMTDRWLTSEGWRRTGRQGTNARQGIIIEWIKIMIMNEWIIVKKMNHKKNESSSTRYLWYARLAIQRPTDRYYRIMHALILKLRCVIIKLRSIAIFIFHSFISIIFAQECSMHACMHGSPCLCCMHYKYRYVQETAYCTIRRKILG